MANKLEEYLPYGRHEILNEDIEQVVDVLKSGWLTQGPKIPEFENSVSNYLDMDHGVACNSGTAALHMAYFGTGVNEVNKILVPGITFAATANAAKYLGAEVEFVDIDRNTWCVEPDNLKNHKNWDTLSVVHFAGNIPNMAEITRIVEENQATLIEDTAHALGSKRSGKFAGSFGNAGTLSFHPVKHVAAGEGGMVVTNDEVIAERAEKFRTHGITTEKMDHSRDDKPYYYEMQELGFNYRMPDILAALAISQFKRLDENIKYRNKLANLYKDEIDDMNQNISYQKVDKNVNSAYHIFPILFDNIGMEKRDKIFRYLRSKNVGVQLHYIPVYHHPYYKKQLKQNLPNCEYYYSNALTLPLFHSMETEKVQKVIEILKEAMSTIL